MLVYVTEKIDDVNDYLKTAGLWMDNNRVYGKIPDDFDFDKTMGSPSTKLEHTLHRVVKAVINSDLRGAVLALYVGNLPYAIGEDFTNNGFVIDKYNVIIIRDATYENYSKLINMNYFAVMTKPFVKRLIRDWPTIFVSNEATVVKGTMIYPSMEQFVYQRGALKYHARLPTPLSDMDNSIIEHNVLVDIIENFKTKGFKYTVKISDYPPILTNELPAPNDLVDLIKYSNTVRYKLIKYIRGLVC